MKTFKLNLLLMFLLAGCGDNDDDELLIVVGQQPVIGSVESFRAKVDGLSFSPDYSHPEMEVLWAPNEFLTFSIYTERGEESIHLRLDGADANALGVRRIGVDAANTVDKVNLVYQKGSTQIWGIVGEDGGSGTITILQNNEDMVSGEFSCSLGTNVIDSDDPPVTVSEGYFEIVAKE